jgi:hypothetical protein
MFLREKNRKACNNFKALNSNDILQKNLMFNYANI